MARDSQTVEAEADEMSGAPAVDPIRGVVPHPRWQVRCSAPLASILFAVTGLGCSPQGMPEPGPPPGSASESQLHPVEPMVEVSTARVRRGSILQRVTAPGSLRARRESRIGAEVSGRIQQVFVNDGDRVEAGAPLFEVDRGPFEMALAPGRGGARRRARRTRRRSRPTSRAATRCAGSDIVAAEQLERMRTQVAVAKARERQAAEAVALARHHLEQTLRARALRRVGRAAAGRRGHAPRWCSPRRS